MTHTICAHLIQTPEPEHLDYLRGRLEEAVTLSTGDDIPPETQVLIAGRPTRAQLEALPNLRAVMIPFVGLPAETRDLLTEPEFRHIAVHNSHHNAPMTAEMALALLFSTARHIVPVDRVFRTGDWQPHYEAAPALVLDGKTALVLGYGEIGQRVADVLRALRMQVLAIKRHVGSDVPDFLHPPEHLHDLLPQINVLMICLPGTPETTGMIGAAELALMPPGGIVVNVGRGPVIDQHALYDALKSGHLFGAGLDVWWNYPQSKETRSSTFPADVPLHELENVVMSPHRSDPFHTEESRLRRLAAIADKLNTFASNGHMPDCVDLSAGY